MLYRRVLSWYECKSIKREAVMLVGGEQCDGGLRFDCGRFFPLPKTLPIVSKISHLFQKGHLQFAAFFLSLGFVFGAGVFHLCCNLRGIAKFHSALGRAQGSGEREAKAAGAQFV